MTTPDLAVLRVRRATLLDKIADANTAMERDRREHDDLHRQLMRLDMQIAIATRAARHAMPR